MPLDPLSWRDTLAPGDIVAFAFPTTDAAQEKHRPALVLAIDRSGAVAEAVVVYGTAAARIAASAAVLNTVVMFASFKVGSLYSQGREQSVVRCE